MSIVNSDKLIWDLSAVIASITVQERDLLGRIQKIIDERVEELEEDYGYQNDENSACPSDGEEGSEEQLEESDERSEETNGVSDKSLENT